MNLESAIKYLTVAALLYVIIRSLAPSFFEVFKEKVLGIKSKDHLQDLDGMIRRKQDILRQQNLSSDTPSAHSKSFTDLYKNHSDENVKKTYELLTELQWGQSKTFENWLKEVNDRIGADLDLKSAFVLFKGIFYGENSKLFNHPLSIGQIHKLAHSIFEMKARAEGIHPEFESWQHTERVYKKHIQKAISYLSEFPKMQKSLSQDLLKISPPEREEDLNRVILKISSYDSTQLTEIDSQIKELATLFALLDLSPFAEQKNKINLNQALKVFAFDELPSEEQLKQARRCLVKSRHPDKLARLKLSPKLEKIATQNYQVIESAHRIILEEIHKE